jgi:hypothetical protein
MKKRKTLVKMNLSDIVFNDNIVSIYKTECGYFFEIGEQITDDVAEAVSILMKKVDSTDSIWKTRLDDFKKYSVIPEKSLYWLSGGQKEWDTLVNYNKPWCESYIHFQEKFGTMIVEAVENSKTLADVKSIFEYELNLLNIYEFALSESLIK